MSKKTPRWVQRLASYKAALARLGEALELASERELSDLEKQGLIQAFEFTFELSWKVLKDFLEEEGSESMVSASQAYKTAFERGLLARADILVKGIESRNLTTHTYNEEVAAAVIRDVTNLYYSAYVELADRMSAEKERRGL